MIRVQQTALKAGVASRAMLIHYQEFQYYIQFQQSAGRACALIGGLEFAGMLFVMFNLKDALTDNAYFPCIYFCCISQGAGLIAVTKSSLCSMLAPGYALRADGAMSLPSPLCAGPLRQESREIFYLQMIMIGAALLSVCSLLVATQHSGRAGWACLGGRWAPAATRPALKFRR